MRNKLIASIICLALAAGLCLAYDIYPFKFPKDEVFVFVNHQASGKSARVINTYFPLGADFVVKQTEENGAVTKIIVDKNFIPKIYKKISKNGTVLEYAQYSKGKLLVKIPSKRIAKTVPLPATYYDAYTLFYTLRKFPFDKKKEIKLNLVYHDPGNIRVVEMSVKYLGKETVRIGAGTFTCHRLEMGTSKALDKAVWPYKYNFWFTADANKHFVKFTGRERDASALVSELAIYKVGGKYLVKKTSAEPTKSSSSSLLTSQNI